MDIILHPQNKEPLYRQIYRQIISQIRDGALSPDEALLSVRTAARYLGVAVITVKTAYEELEKEGYVYALPAKGYFVSENARDRATASDAAVEKACDTFLDACLVNGWSEEEIHDLVSKELRRK